MPEKTPKNLDESAKKTSINEPAEDQHREFREGVEAVLNNNFMIFLAVMMLPILVIPMIWNLDALGLHSVLQFLDACDVIILILFIVEYFSKLYLASNRIKHFLSGWHLVDLVIIILSLLGLVQILEYGVSLPNAPAVTLFLFRGSRVLRIFALGSKTLTNKLRARKPVEEKKEEPPEMMINEVDADLGPNAVHRQITIDMLKSYMSDTKPQWIDITNVRERDFEKLSELLQIPVLHFQSKLIGEGFPRLDFLENATLIFLHSSRIIPPGKHENKYLTVLRHGILIICIGLDMITISPGVTDIFESVLASARKHMAGNPSLTLILHELLQNLISKTKIIVNDIELLLIKLESINRPQNPSDYLERAFHLKKEVSRIEGNMVHLKDVISSIASRKFVLDGYTEQWREVFTLLKDEASNLHESIVNAREEILSMIDLHLNRNSYETNKVMRIIAVLTALALIPAMISGMLGENLKDALPIGYNAYLWQIVCLTLLGMSLVLYVFVKLGWTKS